MTAGVATLVFTVVVTMLFVAAARLVQPVFFGSAVLTFFTGVLSGLRLVATALQSHTISREEVHEERTKIPFAWSREHLI